MGVELGRIQIFNSWSPYMVEEKDSKVWIGLEYFCTERDAFWNMTDEESIQFAIDELLRMGIINKVEDVKDYQLSKQNLKGFILFQYKCTDYYAPEYDGTILR